MYGLNNFDFDRTIEILENTPDTIIVLTRRLSGFWTNSNEGPDTWTVFDVVGHLLHGEKTDWMTRTKIILSNQEHKLFKSFDRFAQFETSKGKTLNDLCLAFKQARMENLQELKSMNLTDDDYSRAGIHPVFGEVTLRQLLSTWAIHDLDHIGQISRVMAKQYKNDTGPWIEYLKILRQ